MAEANLGDRSAEFRLGSQRQALSATFAPNGEYWTIGFAGQTFSIRPSKGLAYIYRLLQHPGEEFHALDLLSGTEAGFAPDSSDFETLASGSGITIGRLGDSGEALDLKAKQHYRERLIELRQEQAEAQTLGNSERAARIQSEIDALARELSRAVGLGGRDRRMGSAAERARLNVTRAVRSALQKISERDAGLGGILDRSIRTGSFCSFVEDRQQPIHWRFSLQGSESDRQEAETIPPLSGGQASTLQAAERTRFVGRAAEQSTLRLCLESAKAARGTVVTICGPPGIGKTRLAREFCKAAANTGVIALSGACYDRGNAVPFNPFVEILEAASELWSRREFRDVLGDSAAELALLMPQLRQKFPDIPPVMPVAPEQSRRMLLSAFVEFLVRASARNPVLLVIDDLHWADEGSLSLLSHIARSIAKLPVVIIGTYRNQKLEFSEELAATLDGCTRLHVLESLELGGLSKEEAAEMIAALSGREPPPPVLEVIYSGCEGNPLFIEELVRHLVERGKLVEPSGEFRRGLQLRELEVPQSLKLMIGRRLARISEGTRKFLEIAAVIGRSFTFALFEASCEADPDVLLDSLEEAEAAGLFSSSLEQREALFQFSHELIRIVVLEQLSALRQQRLHLRVADAIERIYSHALEEKINDLSYHLWNAGALADAAKTVDRLMKAAKRAKAQSAYEAALVHLGNALQRLHEIKPSPERDQLQLGLYLEYLNVVRLTSRWTTPEAGAIYKSARELSERLGKASEMCAVLEGSAGFHLLRAEYALARDYAHRIIEISRSSSELAYNGNFFLGYAYCCQGDLVSAHRYLSEAGGRTKIAALGIDGMVLWMQGYPDRAIDLAEQAVRLAEASNSRTGRTTSWIQLHIIVLFRREFSRALEIAQRGVREASDKQLEWFGTAIIWSMEACRILGGLQGSIDRARNAFDAYFAAEVGLYKPYLCTVLAECYGVLGQVETGISLIEKAFSSMEEKDERMGEPETWRVKASLLQQLAARRGTPVHRAKSLRDQAETCLRTALSRAQVQTSKMWELRAAVDLASLLKNSCRAAEARELLGAVYGWFTEGFDTPDLMQARTLLGELSA